MIVILSSVGLLWPVTLDCFRVSRIDSHVDTTLPFALERIAHVEGHFTDVLDFDFDCFTILQSTEALVICATGDEITRIHGHDRSCELDQFGYPVLHVIGVIIVT